MNLHDRLEMGRWMLRGKGKSRYGHTNGPLIQELLEFEEEVAWLKNEERKRALNNAPPWSSSSSSETTDDETTGEGGAGDPKMAETTIKTGADENDRDATTQEGIGTTQR